MAPDPDAIRETITQAGKLEREWQRKVPETDRSRTPWMPFPIPAFIALLAEALPEADGSKFLGIGAGIGTKELLAREIFGLEVLGIEVEKEYVAQAEALGVPVRVIDAAYYTGYGNYDILWFNRVFRDPDLQLSLEKIIWDGMAPGAVVICANLESFPPDGSFWPVLDDLEVRRGIFYKVR